MACVEVKVRRLKEARADRKDTAAGINRRADCESILRFQELLSFSLISEETSQGDVEVRVPFPD
jgi:hypothetical protein